MPSGDKCAELQAQDDQGWCPLHYAARYYCPDILAAALDVEEGGLCVCVRERERCVSGCGWGYWCMYVGGQE